MARPRAALRASAARRQSEWRKMKNNEAHNKVAPESLHPQTPQTNVNLVCTLQRLQSDIGDKEQDSPEKNLVDKTVMEKKTLKRTTSTAIPSESQKRMVVDGSMEVESFGPHGAEASSTPQVKTTAGISAARKRPSDTSVQEAEFASGSGSLPDPRSPVP
eukprot:8417200-Heterocapsa_arctica.AAC.1